MQPMTSNPSRRKMLQTAAAGTLAAPWIGWKTTASGGPPSGELRFANMGAGGRAWSNLTSMAQVDGVTLAAVAEVDEGRTGKVRADFPDTQVYADWRKLLEKEGKNLDAVIVSTPDHMHAPIAMSAMQLGIHCYCEKPMTRTLHEARALTRHAAENGIVTQMGIQVSSGSGNRTAVKLLREGIVGKVREVHSMNPKSWGSLDPLPDRVDEVPEGLDWDAWIGVGKSRPYLSREFHPSMWRKRIGFGTGTLGDMGCHIYHPWFMGLRQPEVLSVTSYGPGPVDADSWPLNAKVHHRMKGNDLTAGDFDFTWYDGTQLPPDSLASQLQVRTRDEESGEEKIVSGLPRSGSVVVGDSGALVIPHGGAGMPVIFRDGWLSDEEIEEVPSENHHANFADAIRGTISKPPRAHFGYAGPMTELVLLGTVAMRVPGETLTWDAKAGEFPDSKEAGLCLHEAYREGWEVEGI